VAAALAVALVVAFAALGGCAAPAHYERGGGTAATAAPATGFAPSKAGSIDPSPAPAEAGVIPRAALENARAAGAGVFMTRVDLSDVRDGARFIGWRVRPKPGGEALFGPGRLESEDVVVRVNGLALGKPDEFMFAWETAMAASEIRVELLRRGTTLTLSFEVR
jgi:type II secretory pathway component PulC